MTVRRLRPWVVLGLLLASIPAVGDEIRIVPLITVKEAYNDNVFFLTSNKVQDFITTLSPGLNLERNTERLKAMFSGRLDNRFYGDNTDLNATDQFYSGSVSYAFTPRLRMGAKAGYLQDSSPDRNIVTTGQVLNASRRDRQNYGVSGDYVFSEKTMATLSGDYYEDRYAQTLNSINNVNASTGNLMVIHDISAILPETKARFGLGYANYRFPNASSTVDNYSGTIGLGRQFSEVWQVAVDVGPRYTNSQFEVTELQFVPPFFIQPVTVSEETSAWGAMGNAVLSYKGEKTSLDFTLNQDIQPSSSGGGATNRTGLSVGMRRKFTQELSGVLTTGYFLNKSDQSQYSRVAIDEKTLYVAPGIRYDITRDMAVDLTYNYTQVDYQQNNSTADRNLVWVRFSLQYPLFE